MNKIVLALMIPLFVVLSIQAENDYTNPPSYGAPRYINVTGVLEIKADGSLWTIPVLITDTNGVAVPVWDQKGNLTESPVVEFDYDDFVATYNAGGYSMTIGQFLNALKDVCEKVSRAKLEAVQP